MTFGNRLRSASSTRARVRSGRGEPLCSDRMVPPHLRQPVIHRRGPRDIFESALFFLDRLESCDHDSITHCG